MSEITGTTGSPGPTDTRLEAEPEALGTDPATLRTALVTGASRGIGAHLVRGLLDAGWAVVALTRGPDLPDGVAGRPRLHHVRADVTDAAQVHDAVEAAYAAAGHLDLLVNNAGVIETEAPIWESDPDQWWGVLETNVRGPYLLSRAVAPRMLAAGGGRIVSINSGSATRESADLSAYSASKSALARVTGALAKAGAEGGLHAFDLAPGVISTDMTGGMVMHADRTEWTDPADVVDLLLALASGDLDAFSGRLVRAGADQLADLRAAARGELGEGARMLRLRPYGPEDPLA